MLRNLVPFLACALWAASAGAQAPKGDPDTEKLEAAAEQLARMRTSMKEVLQRVQDARNEKDIVKLNCVNEKLTQMKALLRIAEQADAALREAVAHRDPGADSEFAKLGIARSKVEGLRADSRQCTGRLAYVVDERTTVEVQAPSDLPGEGRDDDETRERRRRGPPFPAPPIVRPPPASRWYE